jgi:RNA polymerase sigma factor (sigma-70 family)
VPASAEQTDEDLLRRFAREQDETAFAILVERHGPMVLGVCRRLLDNEHDAEDAFQATFLVLVRRADSLAHPELLGSWLYGVAYRTARKARTQAARRRQQERQAASVATVDEPSTDLAWRELRSTLDDELNRLPDKYRLPLILCYLQGLTNEEAARRLGWPAGSMSYRLARGRELLRERLLGKHGEAPAGFFVVALVMVSATLPAHLVDNTVRAAVGLSSAGGALASLTGVASEGPAVGAANLPGKSSTGRRLARQLGLLAAVAAVAVIGFALLVAYAANPENNAWQTVPPTVGSQSASGPGAAPQNPAEAGMMPCHAP